MVILKTIRLGQTPEADAMRQHCVLGDELALCDAHGELCWLSRKTLGHKAAVGAFYNNIIAIYGDDRGAVRIAIDLGPYPAGVYERLTQLQDVVSLGSAARFWRSISRKEDYACDAEALCVETPSPAGALGFEAVRQRRYANANVDAYMKAQRRAAIEEMDMLFTTGAFAPAAA